MLGVNNYLKWLIEAEDLSTSDGKPVKIFNLEYGDEKAVLSDLAKHLRNHYCSDDMIDELRNGTGFSKTDFLNKLKFPDKTAAPGPSIRAGDFGEILAADYVQYKLNYIVPRTRYENKSIKNESTKGTDVIGFKLTDVNHPQQNDELITVEVKAKFTGDANDRLQVAFDESTKDYNLRKAESLNAMKQRLKLKEDIINVDIVQRFQDKTSRPYNEITGAAVIISNDSWTDNIVSDTNASTHPNPVVSLIAIRGADLMELVHEVYERAADEA